MYVCRDIFDTQQYDDNTYTDICLAQQEQSVHFLLVVRRTI